MKISYTRKVVYLVVYGLWALPFSLIGFLLRAAWNAAVVGSNKADRLLTEVTLNYSNQDPEKGLRR